jgi:hypothetical protein
MKSRITGHPPPRRLQNIVRLLALLLLILPAVSLPAGTQADAAISKTGQAVLHIQVQVVPVAQLPPADRATNPSHPPIDYNIPTSSPQMDVTKESRPLPAGVSGVSGAGASKDAWLETVTVVPR